MSTTDSPRRADGERPLKLLVTATEQAFGIHRLIDAPFNARPLESGALHVGVGDRPNSRSIRHSPILVELAAGNSAPNFNLICSHVAEALKTPA